MHAADIAFTGVEVDADAAIGDPENGLPLIERVSMTPASRYAPKPSGAMDESFKTTIDYLKTRT
jgi:alkylation response protein AidB-like acyl-CoA dehydrogenase